MPSPKAPSEGSELVLGWRVGPSLDPSYWLERGAKAGLQPPDELFTVPSIAMATHTAIIAQSGSGKSAFLGRLIEEIALRTKARCLILDPNADFKKVHEVAPASLWKKASYNRAIRSGRLPHESSRKQFATAWSKIPIRIRTGSEARGVKYEPFQISWPSLSMDFIAEDVTPMLRSELYHCHAFVKTLGEVLRYIYLATGRITNIIDEAEEIVHLVRDSDDRKYLRHELQQRFNVGSVLSNRRRVTRIGSSGFLMLHGELLVSRTTVERTFERLVEGALTISDYVSREIERFYFGRARLYQASGMLQPIGTKHTRSHRHTLEIIDIPNLDRSTRLLALDALLRTEWDRARSSWNTAVDRPEKEDTRIPTFIVVDEAHNLIPREPRNRAELALREQFRTVVAEGRKYGLFLILVSQRPDKLDSLILSECENRAVMKLGSESVLAFAREMLGLQDLSPKLLSKCLDFEIGRALLVGQWSPSGPQVVYAAARRTVEGGRNLRSSYWAVAKPLSVSGTASRGPTRKK